MDGLERGPPYYPKWFGWVPGLRSRSGGGDGGWEELVVYQSGCQAVGHKAKRGQQAAVGNVKAQKPIISTALLLNFPCLSWNACWQLAAANLLTPTHANSLTLQARWNLQETTAIIDFYL